MHKQRHDALHVNSAGLTVFAAVCLLNFSNTVLKFFFMVLIVTKNGMRT